MILQEDARVPVGHLAVAPVGPEVEAVAGGDGGPSRKRRNLPAGVVERTGLVLLRRGARVRVLSASEGAVALPR